MKQLGVLDAAFINLEQGNTPQHIGGLGIYDPSTAPGGFVRFKQVIARTEARLAAMPLFRTRLIEVPGGLDRPYWVKDAHFDVEFHMRHIALPQPGDWRQLCIQVARLHSRPLDMSRPLWEAYIIEGLDNIPNLPKGCFAVYTKMHHALVDGAGGASFMSTIHDLTPDPDNEPILNEPRLVDAEPSVSELLAKASINTVKNTFTMASSAVGVGRDLGKFALNVARNKIPTPDVNAPKTLFNTPVGPHRSFDAAEFPLEGFKDIKNATGTKINDVALAVIGGALMRYLDTRDELPEGSLAAGIPLNMRDRRGHTDENNNVGSTFTSLHSDIRDPLERLRAVTASSTDAKTYGEASPMTDTLKLAGVFSPVVAKAAASFWSRNQLSKHIPLNISTVVSNVAGPDFALYCAGARMVDYYGLGVLTPGMGIFHLVFSYSGRVTLSVLADRGIMPNPELYHDLLVASYEELYAAAVDAGQIKADTKAKKAALLAKAKIESPKRRRAVTRPKTRAGAAARKAPSNNPATAASNKAKKTTGKKTPTKPAKSRKTAAAQTTAKKVGARKTSAKAPAVKKAAAKRKSATKASAVKPRAKRKAATGTARPKLAAK